MNDEQMSIELSNLLKDYICPELGNIYYKSGIKRDTNEHEILGNYY